MAISEEVTLTTQQQHYLDWLCTAPSERVPVSKAKYAIEYVIDESTLRRWQKKEVFINEWKKRVDEVQGSPERTQKLLDTLYNKALEGDVKSAQLYLQATNRMLPPTVTVNTNKKATELSDSELDELIGQIASHEKTKRTLKVV